MNIGIPDTGMVQDIEEVHPSRFILVDIKTKIWQRQCVCGRSFIKYSETCGRMGCWVLNEERRREKALLGYKKIICRYCQKEFMSRVSNTGMTAKIYCNNRCRNTCQAKRTYQRQKEKRDMERGMK